MRGRKDTGEMAFFQEIWEGLRGFERASFVSGVRIDDPSPAHFHHVLPKGKYPEMRLVVHNIVLLTREEHTLVHSRSRSDLEGMSEGWKRYFEYEDLLKEEISHVE